MSVQININICYFKKKCGVLNECLCWELRYRKVSAQAGQENKYEVCKLTGKDAIKIKEMIKDGIPASCVFPSCS